MIEDAIRLGDVAVLRTMSACACLCRSVLQFDEQRRIDQPVPPFDVPTRHEETHGRQVYAPHQAPFFQKDFYEAYNLIPGLFFPPRIHLSVSHRHAE